VRQRPRVILNDRVLFRPWTGVGHYVAQLLTALRAAQQDIAVEAFLSRWKTPRAGLSEPSGNDRHSPPPLLQRVRASWPVRRVAQTAYRFIFRLGARGYDLYHEPNHIPIRCALPTVTTIHDLSVLEHPEWHPADRVRWYEREFCIGVRQTRRFLAVSEFTRDRMVDHLGLSPDVIDVTHLAARPSFRPPPPEVAAEVCARLSLPTQFFLFVGTLEPRKNVAGLLEAYAALPAGLRRRCPLVLVGGWGWKMEALAARLEDHDLRNDVRLLGYRRDPELAALYARCTAFVWPTLYEGFGLPPLEAMACGAPVIVSNVASLPEVVGDAGILLDPHDSVAWTAAMQRMAEDAGWRADWQARSPARAGRFAWERCAAATIACYQRALENL